MRKVDIPVNLPYTIKILNTLEKFNKLKDASQKNFKLILCCSSETLLLERT